MRRSMVSALFAILAICVIGSHAAVYPYQSCYDDPLQWNGTIDYTISGRRCQRWDSMWPHRHHHGDSTIFPEMSATKAENYCRAAGGGELGPWCYTTDPAVRWELCAIPKCAYGQTNIYTNTPTMLPIIVDGCWRNANKYNGYISRTISGRRCQRWDDQTPHTHQMYSDDDFPDGSVQNAENYCRDPDKTGVPWCFTTDPVVRVESCPVPACGNGDCFTDSKIYTGTVSHTLSGTECMRWGARGRTIEASKFPDTSIAEVSNHCRDPDGTGAPWCFTEGADWSFCPVPRCPEQSCFTNSKEWKGQVRYTITGRTCQHWNSKEPHNHRFDNIADFPDDNLTAAENFCRDPDEYGTLWCFTTDADVQWEICGVPPCANEYCYRGDSRSYNGKVFHTIGGRRCQPWRWQIPHAHNNTDGSNFPDGSVNAANNYCRDPEGKGAPWCYTLDKDVEWEYCSIPACP